MKTFKLQIKQQNTGHKFVSNSIFEKKITLEPAR